MSLPTSPNRTTPQSLRQGDQGWPVFALQCGLDELGYDCDADGIFGPATYRMVQAFQRKIQTLTIDGIAGSATQTQIVRLIDISVHEKHPQLPYGLLRGFALSESGNSLGATNWNVSGGVDCGVVQIRCAGPPFYEGSMRIAYDPTIAMDQVAVAFLGRTSRFSQLVYARQLPIEWAMRCAALAWNWPWAAEQFASRGKLPNPSLDATWAVVGGHRVKFPDGAPVMTYDDWARFYALGGEHGEGRVTRFVTEWA
jgi:hypothetical protein